MGSGDMLVIAIAPRGQEQIIACGGPHPSYKNRDRNRGCRRTGDSHFTFMFEEHD